MLTKSDEGEWATMSDGQRVHILEVRVEDQIALVETAQGSDQFWAEASHLMPDHIADYQALASDQDADMIPDILDEDAWGF